MDLRELDLQELDRLALRAAGDAVAGIGADQLDLPTPCTAWTLRELLLHMVSENLGFAVNAEGVPDRSAFSSGRLGDEPTRDYLESAERVAAAFAEDGVLDRRVEVREFGVFSGRVAISLHFVDYLVHSWDVAKAIGLPGRLDEELAATALEIAHGWPYSRPDGVFDVKVEVPDGSPAGDRLVAYLGRPPSWTPPAPPRP